MHKSGLDLERYASLARQVAAEGCVLLKNENEALPLAKGDRVAVFGRCAFYYYKSGLGSGGLVNTRYVVSILDALEACEDITLNHRVQEIYQSWIQENPVDEGHGWGTVPWSQKEMPITDEVLDAAKSSNVAIVVIGRTAGEDQDNAEEEGSYLLTRTEEEMIQKVSERFERTVVLLNVGNIIDMSWVEEYRPAAVLYAWQGGQEGGNAVVDVLTGKVNPCGKLTDTIAYGISDYPSTVNFGNSKKNYYQEDIYVGYRYFETFAKNTVQYPFGYGLSYTQFVMTSCIQEIGKEDITIAVMVKNVGDVPGKEVVQVYIEAPQGKLGKPLRVLAGFRKTRLLKPQEEQWMKIVIPKSRYASYDDSGVTGHKNCFLLEAGTYRIYVGSDVRSAAYYGSYEQGLQILEQLEEACAPVEEFERYKPYDLENGNYCVELEKVPLREVEPKERIKELRDRELAYTGDKGHCLADVYEKKITLDEFIAQLSEDELLGLFYGEGMCSPKVTPGTAGAFGGVTDSLAEKGIPVACCADGPSGIRMDCGTKAFSLPNGTALGCSFNIELVQELFEMVGAELWKQKIDTLLGPGINIHRNPLNGRNFEYVSEDPLLTGLICVAQLKGMHKNGATGTIKHFCANNQEKERCFVESVVSQRALREIYLKVYEIAVKEGNAKSIMTSYGPVNGIWTAGNYDLCTTILRKQWGYEGIVMTDWWAAANWEGEESDKTNRAPMILAQNDIYMCCADAKKEMTTDNVKEMLHEGVIQTADMQRNAKNILNFLLQSQAMLRLMGMVEECAEDAENADDEMGSIHFYETDASGAVVLTQEDVDLTQDEVVVGIITDSDGEYYMEVEATSELNDLAQLGISLYMDNIYREMITFRGMNGEKATKTCKLGYMLGRNHYVKIVRSAKGLDILKVRIYHEAR
ncbi:MAG: beta-glucosidase [Lachnospiraceae bacterium]|nr:beta-glucosidase [Lachnospiraceae bacterium]